MAYIALILRKKCKLLNYYSIGIRLICKRLLVLSPKLSYKGTFVTLNITYVHY